MKKYIDKKDKFINLSSILKESDKIWSDKKAFTIIIKLFYYNQFVRHANGDELIYDILWVEQNVTGITKFFIYKNS